jgi:ribosomal protein L10
MSIKQKKYISIVTFAKLINEKSDFICLVTHVNDMTVFESNLLKIYCESNNIKIVSIKLNLLKKLTKNSLFSNLFAGPTKIFFFEDSTSFLNFNNYIAKEQQLVPLAILYKDNIFSYKNFTKRLKETSNKNLKDSQAVKDNFILRLNQNSLTLLNSLIISRNNFILFLSIINKKINN